MEVRWIQKNDTVFVGFGLLHSSHVSTMLHAQFMILCVQMFIPNATRFAGQEDMCIGTVFACAIHRHIWTSGSHEGRKNQGAVIYTSIYRWVNKNEASMYRFSYLKRMLGNWMVFWCVYPNSAFELRQWKKLITWKALWSDKVLFDTLIRKLKKYLVRSHLNCFSLTLCAVTMRKFLHRSPVISLCIAHHIYFCFHIKIRSMKGVFEVNL